MGIFDSIGGFFNRTANSINNSVFKPIYNSGIRPIYDSVIKPVYSDVLVPVVSTVTNATGNVISKVTDKIEKVADVGINTAANLGQGIGNIANTLSNPIVLLGGLVVGGIVLSAVLNRK